MKKLLCVWGSANYGKTSSIIEFDKILNQNYSNQIIQVSSVGTYKDDIQRIYKIGKVTVGIESQGDPNSRQKSSLSLFGKNNCDIIICASRSRGNTVANVDNFCKRNGYDCFWISTLYSPKLHNQYGLQINQRSGESIYNIFNDFMGGKY